MNWIFTFQISYKLLTLIVTHTHTHSLSVIRNGNPVYIKCSFRIDRILSECECEAITKEEEKKCHINKSECMYTKK